MVRKVCGGDVSPGLHGDLHSVAPRGQQTGLTGGGRYRCDSNNQAESFCFIFISSTTAVSIKQLSMMGKPTSWRDLTEDDQVQMHQSEWRQRFHTQSQESAMFPMNHCAEFSSFNITDFTGATQS